MRSIRDGRRVRFAIPAAVPGSRRWKGGGGTNTTTTQSGPPAQVLQNYQQVYNQAQNVAQQPYPTYGGSMVAGFQPQQIAGFNNINTAVNAAQPFLNAASQDATNATSLLSPQNYGGTVGSYMNPQLQSWLGAAEGEYGSAADMSRGAASSLNAQNFGSTVGNYYSPYAQSVIAPTEAQFANQNAQQFNQIRGNAAAQGAFGGDREAVAEAQAAGQQQLAQAPVIANLETQGWQNAVQNAQQAAGQQQQTAGTLAGVGSGLTNIGNAQESGFNAANSAAQANAWLNSQGSFAMGNLGQEAQTLGLQGANAQIGAGQLQQQQAQQELAVPYSQWQAAQGYPYQLTNWLEGLATGTGGMSGTTGSQTSPGPSAASQAVGLGLAGVGAYGALSNAGAFSSGAQAAGDLSSYGANASDYTMAPGFAFGPPSSSTGGRIERRAPGGMIGPNIPGEGMGIDIPNTNVNIIPQPAPSPGAGLLGTNTGSTSTGGGGSSGAKDAQAAIGLIGDVAMIAALASRGGAITPERLHAIRSLRRDIAMPRRDGGPIRRVEGGDVEYGNPRWMPRFSADELRGPGLQKHIDAAQDDGDVADLRDTLRYHGFHVPHILLESRGGRVPRRDAGGAVGPMMNPEAPIGSPMQASLYSQYANLPTEKLQELAVRMPQNPMLQRAIQMRRMTPQADPSQSVPGLGGTPTAQSAPGGFAAGGELQRPNGGYIPEDMSDEMSLPYAYGQSGPSVGPPSQPQPPAPDPSSDASWFTTPIAKTLGRSLGHAIANPMEGFRDRPPEPSIGELPVSGGALPPAGVGAIAASPVMGPITDANTSRWQDSGPQLGQDVPPPSPVAGFAPQASTGIPPPPPAHHVAHPATVHAGLGPTLMPADAGIGAVGGDQPMSNGPVGHGAEAPPHHSNFMATPSGMALAAGLGILGGRSPFPGVNIGEGGLKGLEFGERAQERQQQMEYNNIYRQAVLGNRDWGRQIQETNAGTNARRADTGDFRARATAAYQQGRLEVARGNLTERQFQDQFNNGLRTGQFDFQQQRAGIQSAQRERALDQADQRMQQSKAQAEAALVIRRQALAQAKDLAEQRAIQTATNSDLHSAANLAVGLGVPFGKALQHVQAGRGSAEAGNGVQPGTTTGTVPAEQQRPPLQSIFGQ